MKIEVKFNEFLKNYGPSFSKENLDSYFDDAEKNSKEYFYFLNTAGFKNLVLEKILSALEDNHSIHWSVLFELFNTSSIEISPDDAKALVEGFTQQGGNPEYSIYKGLDLYSDVLSHLREEFIDELVDKNIESQKVLYDQLNYFKREGLLEKEKEILDKLFILNPQSKTLLTYEEDYKNRWANSVFKNNGIRKNNILESRIATEENKQQSKLILNSELFKKCELLCKSNLDNCYNFSLLFYFLEQNSLALKIIELSSEYNLSLYKAKLLYLNKKYISCLDLLSEVERIPSNQDEVFETHYLRAQTLWALNQFEKAIQFMKAIVKVRPRYKSAESLLSVWIREYTL